MSDNGGKDSEELAEDRTDWAEDRTILANERTFAGWMRTGLASVGMGLALHAIFGKTDQTYMAKATATGFIVIGIAIFALAFLSARKLLKRLSANSVEPVKPTRMAFTAGAFVGASSVLSVILWWL